jgi:DNA-binding transcriptional LysR family regulator
VQLLERHARGVHMTDAGRLFLDKARAAVKAADDAAETMERFRRGNSDALATGFHWLPLTRWAPMFQALCREHPGTRLHWQPLEFPLARRSPIEGVDVGLILQPPNRPDHRSLELEREPRVVMMSPTHRLADRSELTVADVLDEPFPGCHPAMDPEWQAFWTLDEERGGPAPTTEDRISNADEGTEVVVSGRAIITTPAGMAAAFPHPGLVAVPLRDATPATLSLVWRAGDDSPLVSALVRIAEVVAGARAGAAQAAQE